MMILDVQRLMFDQGITLLGSTGREISSHHLHLRLFLCRHLDRERTKTTLRQHADLQKGPYFEDRGLIMSAMLHGMRLLRY
jgi:hypothetical protein